MNAGGGDISLSILMMTLFFSVVVLLVVAFALGGKRMQATIEAGQAIAEGETVSTLAADVVVAKAEETAGAEGSRGGNQSRSRAAGRLLQVIGCFSSSKNKLTIMISLYQAGTSHFCLLASSLACSLHLPVSPPPPAFPPPPHILNSQVLNGMGMVFEIPFPPFYEGITSGLGEFFQIDLPTLMPIDCLVQTSWFGKYMINTLLPIAIYVLFYAAARTFKSRGMDWHGETLIDACFFIAFLVYPMIASKTFSAFGCVKIEDGSSVLRVDFSIACTDATGATTPTYAVINVYALVNVVVHVLGSARIAGSHQTHEKRSRVRFPCAILGRQPQQRSHPPRFRSACHVRVPLFLQIP